jgi:tetraacyldisaccharide-1-P 4'-kinase
MTLVSCDTFNAADFGDLAKLPALTGIGDPADVLATLRALHAEMLRRASAQRIAPDAEVG